MKTMGAGFARTLADKYPLAAQVDQADPRHPTERLGSFTYARYPEQQLRIYNLYGQLRYGKGVQTSYQALSEAIDKMWLHLEPFWPHIRSGAITVACPRLGAGLAGGKWELIETFLNPYDLPLTVWTK